MRTCSPRSRAILLVLGLVCPSAGPAQHMRLVGQSDLGGGGLNGDVAVVGTTVLVAAGMMPAAGVHAHLYNPYPCPAVTVKVVDLSQPQTPRVVSTIPVPAGVAAHGVAAARVKTATFEGDLAAVALSTCGGSGSTFERGVAYYDVTRPATPVFLGRYQADADIVHADSVPACGAPPGRSSARCATSQHSVALVQRPDGRVLSLSVEPGASASKYPSGDFRVVDVTNPRKPVQVGAFPPPGAPIFSTNGCRPFSAGHGAGFSHGGSRGLLAFYDGGLFVVDLARGAPAKLGQFSYPDTRAFEASAAYVAAARVGGRDLALISEADFIPSSSTLDVEGPVSVARSMFGCEAIFTLYDPERAAQLYRRPDRAIRAALAYIGVGCAVSVSADMHADMGAMRHGVADSARTAKSTLADAYLADPRGRIALIDRSRQPLQPVSAGAGCSVADRVRLAQAAGAVAVVVLQTSATAPQAFSPDGDPAGIRIPVMMIDKPDGDALRTTLCPAVERGQCTNGQGVTASMRDAPGEWGALRVVDVTDPATPREVGVHRTPRSSVFPPPDLSVFSPQRPVVSGSTAFVPWNSDGVRVIDLSRGAPREVDWFVPPDTRDPTGVLPAKAYVMSVGLVRVPARGNARAQEYVVISDVNSGLYVLDAPMDSGGRKAKRQR